MKTTLQTLIFESGLSNSDFAKKVNIKLSTLNYQLSKKNTLKWSFEYARLLKVSSLKGYESGVYVELVIY